MQIWLILRVAWWRNIIFYYGRKKQRLFVIFTMKLFSTALRYLTSQSTLNFSWTSLYFWTWTQIKHQRSNIWIKKQPFISESAVQRGFGSKVTGLQFHRCFILYWCFEHFGHIFPICFWKTSHHLICKEFAILKNIKLAKILEVGKISSCVTSLSTLFREW